MTILGCFNINNFQLGTYPSGFLVHGLVALISLALFVWWTKKQALISFRAWALFMAIVHIVYFLFNCDQVRAWTGLTMADIYFVRGVELVATFVTMFRLYFIIEAHGIDITDKNNDVNLVRIITRSIQRAVTSPENPKKINGNTKKLAKKANNLRAKLLDWLF